MGVGKVHYLCDDLLGTDRIAQAALVSDLWAALLECRLCRLPRPSPVYLGRLRAVAFYEPTLREAIHLMKYEKKQVISKHLIQLLQAHLPQDLASTDYDFLLPIPLHKNRLAAARI